MIDETAIARRHLRHAARLAVRGHGGAEPNPLVGCVIVSPDGDVVGEGFHRQCGGPHAEIRALRRAGVRARGATVYVTLEPCNHAGRTGPCTTALIEAGVTRVIMARRDPNPPAAGGAERLRAAGIDVGVRDDCPQARAVSTPFAHRVATGLPWVIAKWAQTVDGKIATRSGQSQWISGERSRGLVHRERGRVDAILTGIGTVLADDPLLTARCRRPRRVARRIVVDPELRIPLAARVLDDVDRIPTMIVCEEAALPDQVDKAKALRARKVELIAAPDHDGELSLRPVLLDLARRGDVATVLVEAGAGLMGRLFRQRLVNEAWVFVAPLLFGDACAVPSLHGLTVDRLTDGIPLTLLGIHRRGGDVLLRYAAGADQA